MHMYIALLQSWTVWRTDLMAQLSLAPYWDSTQWSTEDNWMYFNKQDTRLNNSLQGGCVNGKHKKAIIIIFILIILFPITISAIPPSLHLT